MFFGDLIVKLVRDDEGGLWELVSDLSFESSTGITITAIKGTRTDFMTVPRIPFVFDALGDRCMKSGVIHDYIYQTHEVERETADKLLQEMLLVEGMSRIEADACFLAVRVGGESHW